MGSVRIRPVAALVLAGVLALATALWGFDAGDGPAAAAGGGGPAARLAATAQVDGPVASGPARAGAPARGRSAFLLELATAPTTRTFDAVRPQGVAAARAAARTQLSRVVAAQARAISALPAGARVLYRTHSVLAGLAVTVAARDYDALERIPGVTAIHPVAPKSLDNASAMPLQSAPQAWVTHGGDLGQDSRIAIIDTGIDYTHADFGGPGTTAAYEDAHDHEADTADPSLYPSDKVVGGYDLVGDAYDADPRRRRLPARPAPRRQPAGLRGPRHARGRVGGRVRRERRRHDIRGRIRRDHALRRHEDRPRHGAEAKLYAYRVFGCTGSTDVAAEAIDMASDPNGDGDPSDHVDVINMSLGTTFGSADDGDAVAVNAAADLGIVVAVAAGNDGDFTDIAGSPGTAVKAITVANTQDAVSVVDGLTVTIGTGAPTTYAAERSVLYDWAHDADLAGSMVEAPAPNDTACDPYSGTPFTGKVVLVEWHDDAVNAGTECGSIQRAANLVAAGATGFVFANDQETFDAGINGSADIPGVIVTKTGGDALRAALDASTAVSVGSTAANAASLTFPDDDDKVAPSSSRGIHAAGDVKPDVAAVGTSVFSAAVGTGDDGVSDTGTSMATPMVAGLAALVHHRAPPTGRPSRSRRTS